MARVNGLVARVAAGLLLLACLRGADAACNYTSNAFALYQQTACTTSGSNPLNITLPPPVGAQWVEITVIGSGGGGAVSAARPGNGGRGGLITARLLLPAGSTAMNVLVAEAIAPPANSADCVGGFGGGYSGVLVKNQAGAVLSGAVAGGGGGAGCNDDPSSGVVGTAGNAGQAGTTTTYNSYDTAAGGGAGTASAGGAGGTASVTFSSPVGNGSPGSYLQGGNGPSYSSRMRGGQGGRGYPYGGGGGSAFDDSGTIFGGPGGGGYQFFTTAYAVPGYNYSVTVSPAAAGSELYGAPGQGFVSGNAGNGKSSGAGFVSLRFGMFAPNITAVGPPGSPGSVVTITGANFANATGATVGGVACSPFVIVSATQATCGTSSGSSGTVNVVVTNLEGPSPSFPYTFLVTPPAPTLTSIAPTSAVPGTITTLTGTGFNGATGATLGGLACSPFVVISNTQATCGVPAGGVGTVNVVITGPGGPSSPLVNGFTFLVPPPTVTSTAPSSALPGATTILNGTGFTGATGATLGGLACSPFSVISDTQASCGVPAGGTGTVDVVVTGPGGSSAPLVNGFTFLAPGPNSPPTITSVGPSSGSWAGGTAITVTGTGFTGLTSLRVGSSQCLSLVVVSDTQATCVTPGSGGALGPVDVTATNAYGSGTAPNGYTYTAALAPGRPAVAVALNIVGGGLPTLTAGSGLLLRGGLANITGIPGATAVVTTVTSSTATGPASSFQALANSTVNSTQTIPGATYTAPVTTQVSASDPVNSQNPVAPSRRRLQSGCSPVNLNVPGTVSVTVSSVLVTVQLPETYYVSQGAVTEDARAALLAAVEAQMVTALSSAGTLQSSLGGFVSSWSACTGVPNALGVIAGIAIATEEIPSNSGASCGYGQFCAASVTASWIAFAASFFATVVFGFLAYVRNVKPEARLLYLLVTVINAITALVYLLLALQGQLSSIHGWNGSWQVMWLRYAGWAIVAPLTIIILGLLAGGHWTKIFFATVASVVGVAAAFAAAIDTGFSATWPLFAFGVVAGGLPVLFTLFGTWRRSAYAIHPEVGSLYSALAALVLLLSAAYVVVIAVCDLGLSMSVDAGTIALATFDVITKVVFGFVLIWSRESIARYGSALGYLNTGIELDWPIPGSVTASSSTNYHKEGAKQVVGEHRDLAFTQLRTATGTILTRRS